MSGASTIWAALSLPLSPVGSVPYVKSDRVSITTDATNFRFDTTLLQLNIEGGIKVNYTDSTSNLTGSVSINGSAGRVKIPAGSNTCIVTTEYVDENSVILLQLETSDATLTRVRPTSIVDGQFIVSGNANATASCTVGVFIINASTPAAVSS